VFGKRAALSAIEYIHELPAANTDALDARARESQARIRELFSRTDGNESMSGLRKEMTDTMEKNVGSYRHEAGLREAVDKIAELRQRYRKVVLNDKSNVFTPTCSRRWNWAVCSTARRRLPSARWHARNRVARINASITPSATTATTCATAWPGTRERKRRGSIISTS
jgi:succinate dehydrogenase/fumarate reductase flavoprotein subunit